MADHQTEHHILPLSTYLLVFFALMLGTALTVYVAYIELGWLNTPLALSIAITKASFVVLFFMHVRYNKPLMWVFAGAGFLWLVILFALTMQDYVSRDWETPAPFDFLNQFAQP